MSQNQTPPKKQARFPRTAELPAQSPLFWVEQKDRYLRQLLIEDIEEQTGRRFVTYFANRYEPDSDIQPVDVAHMVELLSDVGSEPVDILIETNGGVTDATEAIISLITSTVGSFRAVVANAAKSNGTLLTLAASSIVMGAPSELGPIEPSIGGIPCSVLDTPQIAAANFPLHMAGKFALQQSRNLAKALLAKGMMQGKSAKVIDDAVDALATRNKFPSHGSVVDHQEAKALGLAVEYLPPDDTLWQRMWLLYCMYDNDCRNNRLLKVFEGRSRSLAVAAARRSPQPPVS